MVNPDTLVDAIRDKLRAIPAVVSMVGNDESRITSYEDDEDSWSIAVNQMVTPSILVVWHGNDPSGDEISVWIQRCSIYLRLNTRLGLAFTNICDSVATGDEQKFTETEFHADFELLDIPYFSRADDEDRAEYPKIDLRFRQRAA